MVGEHARTRKVGGGPYARVKNVQYTKSRTVSGQKSRYPIRGKQWEEMSKLVGDLKTRFGNQPLFCRRRHRGGYERGTKAGKDRLQKRQASRKSSKR